MLLLSGAGGLPGLVRPEGCHGDAGNPALGVRSAAALSAASGCHRALEGFQGGAVAAIPVAPLGG